MGFFKELWSFLKTRKKLWLVPILVVMALLAVLVLTVGNPTVAPFIYTLF